MWFKSSNDDQDDIEDEEHLTGIMFSGLEAHNVNAELAEYASLDDDVRACRDDSLEDIVQEVMPAQCSSESEDDGEERDDPLPTVAAAEAFEHIAQLRKFQSAKEESRKELLALAGIANFVLRSHVLTKQSTIDNFFAG
ncbi:hypothetical protein ISCGN_001112 [Ixodes scapularis]